MDHGIVGGGHCSLPHLLTHQKEIIAAEENGMREVTW